MLLCFFKNLRIIYKNFFKVYDINGRLVKFSFAIQFLLLITAVVNPAPVGYLLMISQRKILLSVDRIYDYTIPIICCAIVIHAFYNDYKDNTYELIAFLNYNNFNYIVFIRWLIYVGLFIVGSFITALIYYRTVSFFGLQDVILALRSIPNIIFLASLILLILTSTKNIYAAIFLTLSYIMCDYLSSSHLFKIFSFGVNTNNFYYKISPIYYIINRILFLIIGILNVYASGRYASK